jgi:hypothetical protein
VGSHGIKRRKPHHELPDLRGRVLPSGLEPSPWTPMGIVGAYGKIARAVRSPYRQQRRAGTVMMVLIGVPAAIAFIFMVVSLARR